MLLDRFQTSWNFWREEKIRGTLTRHFATRTPRSINPRENLIPRIPPFSRLIIVSQLTRPVIYFFFFSNLATLVHKRSVGWNLMRKTVRQLRNYRVQGCGSSNPTGQAAAILRYFFASGHVMWLLAATSSKTVKRKPWSIDPMSRVPRLRKSAFAMLRNADNARGAHTNRN